MVAVRDQAVRQLKQGFIYPKMISFTKVKVEIVN